jgi:hypothetical protein
MNTLDGSPLPELCKKLAESGEKKYAWQILEEYFSTFEETGPRQILWFMLTAAMKLENESVTGEERSNLLFFYEYTIAAFQAAYVLSEAKKAQG